MWLHILYVLFIGLLSIFIIAMIHHLVNYFRDTYTTKKVKNIAETHSQKYKTIIDAQEKERERLKQERDQLEYRVQSLETQQYQFTSQDLQSIDQDLDNFVRDQLQQNN